GRTGPPRGRPHHVQGGSGVHPRLPRGRRGRWYLLHRPRGRRPGSQDEARRYRHAAGHAAQGGPGDHFGAARSLPRIQDRRAHPVGQPALRAGHIQDGHRRIPAQELFRGGALGHPWGREPRPGRRERGDLHAPRHAGAPRRGPRRRPLGEGDRGGGARRPRLLQPPDRRGAARLGGDRQAPPRQRLPEDRGPLQERGGEEGARRAVDRHPRDHHRRRGGLPKPRRPRRLARI
ncbi:MAG: Nitrate/nitrite response regulator protein, partial [uncultured Rubrobacteraceae bacterium]